MAPSADEGLREIEAALGVVFPGDYREFVGASGKVEADFGRSYLVLYSLDELVPLNRAYELAENFPGLVLIDSDGGSEAVGLDFRQSPPQVVLVNFHWTALLRYVAFWGCPVRPKLCDEPPTIGNRSGADRIGVR